MKDIRLSEVIPPHFYDAHRLIREHAYTEYTFPGGRGSCKSSFVSEEIPLLMKRNPDMHCLVLRKYGNTLKDSVYNQLIWAIQGDRFADADYLQADRSDDILPRS